MFQRMMEWVLRDIDNADPYVDHINIGSTEKTWEELLVNHQKDVRRVLDTLKEQILIVDPRKANIVMKELDICGHIIREGRRSPAPGKLLSFLYRWNNWDHGG